MTKLLAPLVISMLASVAWGKTTTTTMSERGFFSVSGHAGSAQRRVLTSEGEYSAFTGTQLGGGADFRVFGSGQGELRVFGEMQMTTLPSRENETDDLKETVTVWGLKAFFSENFYLGAGYGTIVQKFDSSGIETSATNPIVGMGVGFEYPIGANFFVGLHAWYYNNPIRKEGALAGNSFAEGASGSLNLIWSPPITIINTTISGR